MNAAAFIAAQAERHGGGSVKRRKLFGAVGDGAHNDQPAFKAAIEALGSVRGGAIEVPFGDYRLGKTVEVDRKCVIRGAGSGADGISAGTRIIADVGVTAFRVGGFRKDDPHLNDKNGTGSVLEHLCTVAKDKRDEDKRPWCAIYTPNSGTAPDGAYLDLDTNFDPNDWNEGQLIRIPCISASIPLDNVSVDRADPHLAANEFRVKPPADLDKAPGFVVGGYYIIGPQIVGGTYVQPVMCTKTDNVDPTPTDPNRRTITTLDATSGVITVTTIDSTDPDKRSIVALEAQCTPTWPRGVASSGAVSYVPDIFARIVKKNSSNPGRIYIDWDLPPEAPPQGKIRIEHADAGVDMLCQCSVQNCMIGGGTGSGRDNGFHGPAIAIRGATGLVTIRAVADDWSVFNTGLFGCRNGLYIQGTDTSAGIACRVQANNCDQWCFVDLGQNSNTYVTCHVNGLGYLSPDRLPGMTLFGCYQESGAVSRIGANATSISPTVGSQIGDPAAWAGGAWRRLMLSGPTPADPYIDLYPHTGEDAPATFVNYYRGPATEGWLPITHRRGRGHSGQIIEIPRQVWACENQHAFAIADADAGAPDPTITVFPLASTDIVLHDSGLTNPVAPSVLSATLRNTSNGSLTSNPETFTIQGVDDQDQPITDRIIIPSHSVGAGASVTVNGTGKFASVTSVKLSNGQNANWQFSVGTIDGFAPASMWLPRGVMIGDEDASLRLIADYPSVFRLEARILVGDPAHNVPAGVVLDDPYAGKQDGWHRADLVHDAALTDTYPFRMCVQSGRAGAALFTPIGGVGGYTKLTIDANTPVVNGNTQIPIDPNASVPAYVQAYFTESIEVAGSPVGGSSTLMFKAAQWRRWLYNSTPSPLVVQTASGSGQITIESRKAAWVVCNGQDVLRQTPDVDPTLSVVSYYVLTIPGGGFAPGGGLTVRVDEGNNAQGYFAESVEVRSTAALRGGATLQFGKTRSRRWIYNNLINLAPFLPAPPLVVTTGSGNKISISPGKAAWVVCDGTEMKRQTPDTDPKQ